MSPWLKFPIQYSILSLYLSQIERPAKSRPGYTGSSVAQLRARRINLNTPDFVKFGNVVLFTVLMLVFVQFEPGSNTSTKRDTDANTSTDIADCSPNGRT